MHACTSLFAQPTQGTHALMVHGDARGTASKSVYLRASPAVHLLSSLVLVTRFPILGEGNRWR